ncbi:hypothetical protein AnigIFM63326_006469 [Aspergillus niger]|nr:hypothetical protein AnigIFM63326_006469 [Aspergillus niger]
MFYGDHPAEPPKAFKPFHSLKRLVTTVLPFTNGTILSFAHALGEVGHAQTSQKVGFAYEWPKDGSDGAAAQKAVDTISKTVQSLAKTKGTLLDFKYMTFDTGSQKVLGSYGAENIKLMQEVAAKYDPEGVFSEAAEWRVPFTRQYLMDYEHE